MNPKNKISSHVTTVGSRAIFQLSIESKVQLSLSETAARFNLTILNSSQLGVSQCLFLCVHDEFGLINTRQKSACRWWTACILNYPVVLDMISWLVQLSWQ